METKIKIAYVLPGLSVSGGVAVVLKHANILLDRGYEVYIVNIGEKADGVFWYPNNNVPLLSEKDCMRKKIFFDIVIATYFTTVDFILKMNASRFLYFVQSDERRFDLSADLFLKCQSSYEKSEVEFFTMAIWIQRWLKEEFGHEAYYVPNGLDDKLFYRSNSIEIPRVKKRVLLEGPISVAFKGVENAYNAVKDLDCEIWIISSNGKPKKSWRYDRFFESVPLRDMKEIYSSCDILLKMSTVESFAYPPLEAMACGCVPVVKKVTGIEEYAVHGDNCFIVNDVEDARSVVSSLLVNDDLRKEMIIKGAQTVKKWTWDRTENYLEKVIKKDDIEIFYDDHFPERYDYKKTIRTVKERVIKNSAKELITLRKMIQQKDKVIDEMNESVFWKLRQKSVRMKELTYGSLVRFKKKKLAKPIFKK